MTLIDTQRPEGGDSVSSILIDGSTRSNTNSESGDHERGWDGLRRSGRVVICSSDASPATAFEITLQHAQHSLISLKYAHTTASRPQDLQKRVMRMEGGAERVNKEACHPVCEETQRQNTHVDQSDQDGQAD